METHNDWLRGLERQVDAFFAHATDEEIEALLRRANATFYNQIKTNVFSHPIGWVRGMKGRLPVHHSQSMASFAPTGAFSFFGTAAASLPFPVSV